MKHATIVPLIGGATIGQSLALGTQPTWMASYTPFAANDQHIRNYYPDVPFYTLDEGEKPTEWVDVVNTVCPCAGLATLARYACKDSSYNDWMFKTAEYVLSELKPTYFWGENAPGLLTKLGSVVRERMTEIGNKHGYVFQPMPANAIDHGLGQNRARSVYLFSREPLLLNRITRPKGDVREVIRKATASNEMFEGHREVYCRLPRFGKPSRDPFYQFVLKHYGHENLARHKSVRYLQEGKRTHHWNGDLQRFIAEGDYDPYWIDWVNKFSDKIVAEGTSARTFTKGSCITRDGEIGAAVSGQETIIHPDEDRYLNYRELMALMGMPTDFQLIYPKKNVNHIFQNVPVPVAEDFVKSIIQ